MVLKPDHLFMLRGVYPTWGPPMYAATNKDIPVTCWTYAYNPESAFMRTSTKEDFEQFHSPHKKYWEEIKNKPLTKEENLRLDIAMTNRINVLSRGCQSFGDEFPSVKQLYKKLDIDPNKKVWMVNSHCNWDWDTYIENKVLFIDPIEWLIETYKIMKDNNDVVWILRTHPAENKKNTMLGCLEILNKEFGKIPEHIKVLTSKSPINTYSLFPLVEGCITMQSTVGIEMALYGKTVVLGDYGFYGNRGFTYNPSTIKEYNYALMNVHTIPKITDKQIEIAKRYA